MPIPGVTVDYAEDIGSDSDSFITIRVRLEQILDELPGEIQITKRVYFQPHDDLSGLSRAMEIIANHPLSRFQLCESPAEVAFYLAAWEKLPSLMPQYQIGPYRVDFALVESRLVVEIDGHEFHKTQAQRMQDYKRERYIQWEGWQVLRFTALEVFNDQFGCVEEVLKIIDSMSRAE